MTERHFWTMGEALIALVPSQIGPLEHAGHLYAGVGGAEFNVAIGLARLAHGTWGVGLVGDDPWGRRVVRELRAEGVGALARVSSESFTGAYVRERRAGGSSQATYLRKGSAGSLLSEGDIPRLQAGPGDLVHLSGITPALSRSARDSWLLAAKTAKEAGAHVSLDVNFREKLWSRGEARETLAEAFDYVDLIFASMSEAKVVLGGEHSDPVATAAELRLVLSDHAEVVMKLGAAGSIHLDKSGLSSRGHSVEIEAVGPVGAGDAFAAGYLSGVIDGVSVEERLLRAHTCAAFVVGSNGDWEGFPSRRELVDVSLVSRGRQWR